MTRTSRQLVLLPSADWRLDDETRATGRRGIANARAILDIAEERATRAARGRAARHETHRPTEPAA